MPRRYGLSTPVRRQGNISITSRIGRWSKAVGLNAALNMNWQLVHQLARNSRVMTCPSSMALRRQGLVISS